MSKIPWPVRGDAYTVSGNCLASNEAKARSVYNFTNRKGPLEAIPEVAIDNRMILYGMSAFVELLCEEIYNLDVSFTNDFMKTAHAFGGGLNFDRALWTRVVDEYRGNLPIRIEGLPDGSVFWPNEPVIQVTSLGEGFGEIAALIEAVLLGMVSCATARATITRHWLERMRDWVRAAHPTWDREGVDSIARWLIHDFGMRASSTPKESELYGMAHLLSFNGTDSFNAAYHAWLDDAPDGVGTSILALAHRIVQGYEYERNSFEQMYNACMRTGGKAIGSFVADCYDFHSAVANDLVEIAKRGDVCVVVRPDSGDYIENVEFVVKTAIQNNLFARDEQGRPIATTLRFIQGDSMTPEKVDRVLLKLKMMGVNPVRWGVFGVGGYLRNRPNRDLFSSAYKLAAKGLDDRPVVKLSSVRAKMSVPGPTSLVRPPCGDRPTVFFANERCSAYQVYYDGSQFGSRRFGPAADETFDVVRMRATSEFDNWVGHDPHPLSPSIEAFQQSVMDEHKKKW